MKKKRIREFEKEKERKARNKTKKAKEGKKNNIIEKVGPTSTRRKREKDKMIGRREKAEMVFSRSFVLYHSFFFFSKIIFGEFNRLSSTCRSSDGVQLKLQIRMLSGRMRSDPLTRW